MIHILIDAALNWKWQQGFNSDLCNGSERLVLKKGDGDEGAVDDDGHDEDEDKTYLE
jgi:hypothetical protein